MTLRLEPSADEALKSEAARTGQTQQSIVRVAVDQYLGRAPRLDVIPGSIAQLIERGILEAPSEPFRRDRDLIALPAGVTTLDLLQRDER